MGILLAAMIDATKRFSDRVDNYVKYPSCYPGAIIDLLVSRCGLSRDSIIADIGQGLAFSPSYCFGTEIAFSGVEPNREMARRGGESPH